MIRVSRASFFKARFEVTEKELRDQLSGEELEQALSEMPTEDELEFYKIMKSEAPEIERLKRKVSVCLDAEVSKLEDDLVEYEYAGKKINVKSPVNSFETSQSLELGTHSGVQSMMKQGCISIDGAVLRDFNVLAVDEINLLVKIIDKFFFQAYLV